MSDNTHDKNSIEDAFLEWIRPLETERSDRLDCFTAGYLAAHAAGQGEVQVHAVSEYERGRREALAEVMPVLDFYANKKNWYGYHRNVDTVVDDSAPAKADDGFDIMLGGERAP